MKTIQMRRCDTKELVDVQYDETAPCLICGNPVIYASMGGLDICPSCDCGYWRDGRKMDIMGEDSMYFFKWKRHLKPHVPTFDEVSNIAVAMSARGIHVREWDIACKIFFGDSNEIERCARV
jgi:hypothetical protein